MMSHGVSSLFAGIVLTMFVTACAGPTTQADSAGLPGMWHGAFVHPGADYTSPSRADLMLQVRDDSTYTLKWGTRAETTGTIAAQGNRVILNDSSGSQITLMHSGDTLYGVMKDAATGRAAAMNLAKEESAATQVAETSARLCQAAGGVYSGGVCQPAIDQTVVARQCEARGGVYFAADYCEVPAGGLRPRR
jgi:hypothetical protein